MATLILSILQMKKPILNEIRYFAQDYTVCKQSQTV